MKRHPFLLLCLFCIVFSSASLRAQSRLSITLVGNAAIRMQIDDKHYICQDNSLTIDDLAPGYHTIRLFLVKKDRWNNSTYGQMVYNANLLLRQQFYTDIVVNRFGKTMVDEQPFSKGDFYYDGNNAPVDYDRNGHDPRFPDKDRDDHRGNGGGNNGGGYGGNNGGNYGNGNGYDQQPYPMSDDQFATAREAIRKEPFDNTRLSIAQQVGSNNYFTAAQVKELARLFSFDDRRLDFVKYAYARTVDRNNYYILNEVFVFPKSKDDLANYIKNYK